MTKTKEQEDFIHSMQTNHLTKGIACAGTGKTSTVKMGVAEMQPSRGLYIAFAKTVADEAQGEFPETMVCKTIHAYAMSLIPRMKIGYFGYRDIKEKLPFNDKLDIISAMEAFFGSDSTCMEEFFLELLEPHEAEIAVNYINKMLNLEIDATFGFALKYFHLTLAQGILDIPKYDILVLDEAGDVTAVSLDIFRLLKADHKVMVGDPHQNIFGFMNTVDGFNILKDEGTICKLTKSFRVANVIAKRVEKFCQTHLDKTFTYEGVDHTSEPKDETLYIARTNATMIGRMIDLIEEGKGFTLLRSPKEIFALPLALITASSGKEVFDSRFKYLEKEYRNAKAYAKRHNKPKWSLQAYLSLEFGEDIALMAAISLLRKYSYSVIFETFHHVKEMKSHPAITLGSAHSVKGLERDKVYIENDLNDVVIDLIKDGGASTQEQLTEFNLAYVAATRAKHELLNCKFL